MPNTPITPVTPLLDLSRVKLAQGGPPPGSSMSTRTGLEELDEKTLQILLKRNFFTPRQQLQLFGEKGYFHTTNGANYAPPSKEYYNNGSGTKERFVEGVYNDHLEFSFNKPERAFGADVYVARSARGPARDSVGEFMKHIEVDHRGSRKPSPPKHMHTKDDFTAGKKTVRENQYNILNEGAHKEEAGKEYTSVYKSSHVSDSSALPSPRIITPRANPAQSSSIDLRHVDDDVDRFKSTTKASMESAAHSPVVPHRRFESKGYGKSRIHRYIGKHRGEELASHERFTTTKERYQSVISEDILRRQGEDSSDKGFQRSRYDTMVSADAPTFFQLANIKRGRMGATQILVGEDGRVLSLAEARQELADLKNREGELRSYCHASELRSKMGKEFGADEMEPVQKLNGKWVLQPTSRPATQRHTGPLDGPDRVTKELHIPVKGKPKAPDVYVPGMTPFAKA